MVVHLSGDSGEIIFSRSTEASSRCNKVGSQKREVRRLKREWDGRKREKANAAEKRKIAKTRTRYRNTNDRETGITGLVGLALSTTLSIISPSVSSLTHTTLCFHASPPSSPKPSSWYVIRNDNEDYYLLLLYRYYYYSYVGRPLFLVSLSFCFRLSLFLFLSFCLSPFLSFLLSLSFWLSLSLSIMISFTNCIPLISDFLFMSFRILRILFSNHIVMIESVGLSFGSSDLNSNRLLQVKWGSG